MDEENVEIKTIVGELNTFEARELEIYGFPNFGAEVDIQPYEDTKIEVFLTGSAQDLLRIQTTLSKWKGSVAIQRRETAKEEAQSQVVSEETAKIMIRVPKGTSVNLWSFYGRATIGDIESNVNINIAKGHASLGEVTHASLKVSQYGDIFVKKVKGKVTIKLTGFGNIRIEGGYADPLEANIDGAGEIWFNGEAINSILSIEGAGEIYVAKIRNPPTKKEIRGLGRISIGNFTVTGSSYAPC